MYIITQDCKYGMKGNRVSRSVYLSATTQERALYFKEEEDLHATGTLHYGSAARAEEESITTAWNTRSDDTDYSSSRDHHSNSRDVDFGGGHFGGGGASSDWGSSSSSDSSSSDSGSSDCGGGSDD